MKFVFFQTQDDLLSQWYPCEFTEDGISYQSAEQYMMYHKAVMFDDAKAAHAILWEETDPKRQKMWGRRVKGFDEKLWNEKAEEIVFRGNLAKFSSSEEMRNALLSTRKAILAELNGHDKIWATGLSSARDHRAQRPSKWPGQNKLGRVLERVRDVLQEEQKKFPPPL